MLIKDACCSADLVQFLRLRCPCGEDNCPDFAEHSRMYPVRRPVVVGARGSARPSASPRDRADKLLADRGPIDDIRQLIVDWIAEEPSIVTRSLAEALTAREGDGGYSERLLGVLRVMVARR